MLEIKKYTKNELSAVLGTNTKQAIDRKLRRYGAVFESTGRGKNLTYEIKEIPDIFKFYCITELNIPLSVNFEKFKCFCYYLLCDETFASFPIIEMQRIMSADGVQISRQTISNWIRYLSKAGYVALSISEFTYYAITKTEDDIKHYTEITKEKYSKGWGIYWDVKEKYNAGLAYKLMSDYVGGHPYKRPKIEHNIFYTKELEILIDLVNDWFLK